MKVENVFDIDIVLDFRALCQNCNNYRLKESFFFKYLGKINAKFLTVSVLLSTVNPSLFALAVMARAVGALDNTGSSGGAL